MAEQKKQRVAEEQDLLGAGIGVEVEQVEPTDGPLEIAEPFDPEKIEVQTRTMTIDLLLSRIRHKAIDLEPEFQRSRGIWNDQRQSRLIESILLKIPLPTLYAAENEQEEWAIVDGIQRLTAIVRFVDPAIIQDSQLVLQGLEYLGRDFDGKTSSHLPPRLMRRLLETELVVHVIRHGTPDAVKDNIFARINTGGLPLSRQELRHALISGTARKLLKEWAALSEFASATAGSVRDERMTDRELVLRFVAFRLMAPQNYRSADFDRFLGQAMRQMNQLSKSEIRRLLEEFKESLRTAYGIFREYAFRKRYSQEDSRNPINKALFEAITVNLASLTTIERATLVERRERVVAAFILLMNDRTFDLSVSQGTGDVRKVQARFGLFHQLLRGILE